LTSISYWIYDKEKGGVGMRLVVGKSKFDVKEGSLKFKVDDDWIGIEDLRGIVKLYDDDYNEITDYTDVDLVGYLVQTGYLIPRERE
jgi:hypothetical protein